jgi:hypothetical protein
MLMPLGDQVKTAFLLMVISCLIALSLMGISSAVDSKSSDEQVIYSYEGNLSEKNIIPVTLLSIFGAPAFFIAEAVKFEAPKDNWKIRAVQLYGYDGYDGSNESVPAERIIALEIRDKDKNLLYKFADSQISYSNYARNATFLYPLTIEIPEIPVSDEFYVCFYDRGAVAIGGEMLNETSMNSFIYIDDGNELLPATLPTSENSSTPINWIMAVSGR